MAVEMNDEDRDPGVALAGRFQCRLVNARLGGIARRPALRSARTQLSSSIKSLDRSNAGVVVLARRS